MKPSFSWDPNKNNENILKHGVSFNAAQYAFFDSLRVIAYDFAHSKQEERYYCIGKIEDGIVTVRFTYRNSTIRIIGAGFWRKGRKVYEKENNV
ncbi:MAG: BrnT family toxin [Desulfamplus sp.]|nr:BrnT family toxin [Desulfamplus sp.]